VRAPAEPEPEALVERELTLALWELSLEPGRRSPASDGDSGGGLGGNGLGAAGWAVNLKGEAANRTLPGATLR